MVNAITLYGTTACHLCELAQQILDHHNANTRDIDYAVVDISESDELFQRYGLRIPVLRTRNGKELDWPFSSAQLESFLQAG